MTYSQTIEFLYNSLPEFQRVGAAAYKASLDNTHALDTHLGHPHRAFRTIHVAGTNGKGSTAAMIYAVLRQAGYKVGLYTSPHLKDFRERIIVDDQMITQESVTEFVDSNMEIIEKLRPSFFEMTVAMAFDYFRRCKVDIAVVEVGMGGRLDSTNIITPLISVITNIDYDHTQFLGKTLPLIAAEKAGIIKPGVPVVIGESNPETAPVFISKAREMDAPITLADNCYLCTESQGDTYAVHSLLDDYDFTIQMSLVGEYQRKNVCTTLATLDQLKETLCLTPDIVTHGLLNAKIRGRWETLAVNPLTICDTGHNPAGLRYVVAQLARQKYEKLYFVLAMVGDKDVSTAVKLLPPDAHYIFTQASIERAMPVERLAQAARAAGLQGGTAPSVRQAVAMARRMAKPDDMIFIGGSTFTVADALE